MADGGALPTLVKQVSSMDVTLPVIRLFDRRPQGGSAPMDWCFQSHLESALYGNGYAASTGAMYALLRRCGLGHRTLAMKKSSVQAGLVTQQEFEWLRSQLHTSVRSFTLVPTDILQSALATFGSSPRSIALADALSIAHPSAWEEDEEMDEEEGEGGEEAEVDGNDDDDGNGDDEAGDGGGASGGQHGSDAMEEDDGHGRDDPGQPPTSPPSEDDDCPTTEEENDPPVVGEEAKRCRITEYTLREIPASLETELEALNQYRAVAININRGGLAVADVTRSNDRKAILRFMGWLEARGKLPRPTLRIFGAKQIGAIAQVFVRTLVDEHGRTYGTAKQYIGSMVTAARYVHSRHPNILTTAIDQLVALHRQLSQQARLQDRFRLAETPKAWLDWGQVLQARAKAERAYNACDDEDEAASLQLLTDVTILRLHSDQPPDRVSVIRCLALNKTLKRKDDGGYILDLSQPGIHKTSATTGPTRTDMQASLTPWLDEYIRKVAVGDGGYLFSSRGDGAAPLLAPTWSKFVQAVFKRWSGVSFSPKDTRASFVTYMRSGDHGDEVVRAAAIAMRHSVRVQQSASYDKEGTNRQVAAAMQVAEAVAAQF